MAKIQFCKGCKRQAAKLGDLIGTTLDYEQEEKRLLVTATSD